MLRFRERGRRVPRERLQAGSAPSAGVDAAAHWEAVHAGNGDEDVSWTQREPAVSLRLLAMAGAGPDARVVDVGCGAAGLAVALVERGWTSVTGLDVAPSALRRAQERLGPLAARARWVVGDVRAFEAPGPYDVWHDRAVLHFLATDEDRFAYGASLRRSLRVGGHAVVGTFAPDGPEMCSGLPVARYEPEGIVRALGDGFELLHGERETHVTPWGTEQRFAWALARRVA